MANLVWRVLKIGCAASAMERAGLIATEVVVCRAKVVVAVFVKGVAPVSAMVGVKGVAVADAQVRAITPATMVALIRVMGYRRDGARDNQKRRGFR